MEQKTDKDKDCRICHHFDKKSDWMVVDYKLVNREDLSISNTTVGDDNPVLKQISKHQGGFGKVYTVCEKHQIILARNRTDVCNDFERKD